MLGARAQISERAAASINAPSEAVEVVRNVLSLPDERLDYAHAVLAFDRVVDPSTDVAGTLAELDRLAEEARRLAGPAANGELRLAALRTVIYRSGPWNDHRPFDYDHEGYRALHCKLIANYLATRLGNCVSMPILFLILADKLGLDMALAVAPVHFYLRYRDESGRIINLETTSGALPARDEWIRQTRQVSDRGIETGFYMRSLSRREGVAAMASTLVEYLMGQRRFHEAVAVSQIILRHNPRDGIVWAKLGSAYGRILDAEFLNRYGSHFLIPLPHRANYLMLLQRNHAAFAAAKALGWEPVQ